MDKNTPIAVDLLRGIVGGAGSKEQAVLDGAFSEYAASTAEFSPGPDTAQSKIHEVSKLLANGGNSQAGMIKALNDLTPPLRPLAADGLDTDVISEEVRIVRAGDEHGENVAQVMALSKSVMSPDAQWHGFRAAFTDTSFLPSKGEVVVSDAIENTEIVVTDSLSFSEMAPHPADGVLVKVAIDTEKVQSVLAGIHGTPAAAVMDMLAPQIDNQSQAAEVLTLMKSLMSSHTDGQAMFSAFTDDDD